MRGELGVEPPQHSVECDLQHALERTKSRKGSHERVVLQTGLEMTEAWRATTV